GGPRAGDRSHRSDGGLDTRAPAAPLGRRLPVHAGAAGPGLRGDVRLRQQPRAGQHRGALAERRDARHRGPGARPADRAVDRAGHPRRGAAGHRAHAAVRRPGAHPSRGGAEPRPGRPDHRHPGAAGGQLPVPGLPGGDRRPRPVRDRPGPPEHHGRSGAGGPDRAGGGSRHGDVPCGGAAQDRAAAVGAGHGGGRAHRPGHQRRQRDPRDLHQRRRAGRRHRRRPVDEPALDPARGRRADRSARAAHRPPRRDRRGPAAPAGTV
ncbi:MAG: hypothetical protein AVDCRST_MAG07-751, partial [uncultured Frankineae bacterium]